MERGRPRSFDESAALDAALAIFWRDGFHATSLSALTEVMGISKPSLYATFGDKATLYIKALARYGELEGSQHIRVLDSQPQVKQAIEGFLLSCIDSLTDKNKPQGCFIVTGSANFGGQTLPPEVELALLSALNGNKELFKARLARGLVDGQLAIATDIDALASYFSALLSGLAVQAKAGSTRATLQSVVKTAMSVFAGL